MSFVLTRMFAYFTLVSYLVVGTVAVRVLAPEMTTLSFSSKSLQIFSSTTIKSADADTLTAPEMMFAEIKFPEAPKKMAAVAVVKKAPHKAPVIVKANRSIVLMPELQETQVAKNELPFHEPVKLEKVVMTTELQANLVALHRDFHFKEAEMIAAQMTTQDEVKTSMAKSETPKEEEFAEPEFFEYDQEVAATEQPVEKQAEPKIPEINDPSLDIAMNEAPLVTEEIAVDDLVAFDYSKAKEDIKSQTMPMVGTVTTQAPQASALPSNISITSAPKKSSAKATIPNVAQAEQNALLQNEKSVEKKATTTHSGRLSIQVMATDFKQTNPEAGFEVRFQDDLSEAIQDYNNGSVVVDQELATKKMTRSVAVLKRGFAPTNSEVIIEEGVSEVTLPLIEENTFNEMILPYESRGPIGALLVELDDDAQGAALDVPFSKVIQLNGDLQETQGDDFRYQLFVGVKAGNALLSYKTSNNEVTAKIVHIHERELTFEANFFEEVENETVRLFEKDLLAKEKRPLIVSSESVKQFASHNKTGTKLNDHTYKMDFQKTLLGSRRYLELTHQSEPVFVGFRKNSNLEIPSESFMRYILSQFEGAGLGNRCLVQVNLSKKAVKVDVAAESVDSSIATYTQILDRDGKFYDSVSEKSEKVIVVGEHQGTAEHGQDGKINFKVTYLDGSVDYLGSYCSPNTYLVEQL